MPPRISRTTTTPPLILILLCMLSLLKTTRILAKPFFLSRKFAARSISIDNIESISFTRGGGSMESDKHDHPIDSDSAPVSVSPPPLITARFYFVRHGETIANDQGLVVGQWNSPLSERGVKQATALGKSDMMQSTVFWRKYCSDLGRTQQTAQLMMQSSCNDWTLDTRIREIAKGARQEYPKAWDYQRCVEERKRAGKEMPLLETSEDAWSRIAGFIADVLTEAGQESTINDKNADNTPMTLHVLVVSHAGALRTLLQKMCPHADPTLQHQDDPSRPPDDGKRLTVPNTSVTILDVTPNESFWKTVTADSSSTTMKHRGRLGPNDAFFPAPGSSGSNDDAVDDIASNFNDLWDTKIVKFMWTKHLDEAVTTSNDE